MGTTLTGTTPQDTYDSLIKVTDNGPLSGTAKYLSDGLGNDSALAVSTAGVGIGTSTPQGPLEVKGDTDYDSPKSIVITHAEPTVYSGFIGLRQEGLANSVMAFGTRSASVDYLDTLSLSNGNVGIGTTSPLLNLSVVGVSGAESASATPNGSIAIGPTGSNNQILTLGFLNGAGNHTWLQSRNSNQALFYPLILNPSGGNVGIGTSTPSSKLQVNVATTYAAQFNTSQTIATTTRLAIGNYGADAAGAGGGCVALGAYHHHASTAASDFVFYTHTGSSLTEKARILSSGGITFNGDTAAANALDDYEEGTWTMGVAFGGASVGVTYSNNTGTYTKIGRKVTVSGYMALANKGSSTGIVRITGLPFTIQNSISHYSCASLWLNNVTFANQYNSVGAIGTTNIAIEEITEAGVVTQITNSDFANNSEVIVSFTYFV